MSFYDRLGQFFRSGNSAPSVGQVSSESAEAGGDIPSGPIQLRRFSRAEMDMAIGAAIEHARTNASTPKQVVRQRVLNLVDGFRKSENRRRAQEVRANKKPAADPLQSSNVMESQK